MKAEVGLHHADLADLQAQKVVLETMHKNNDPAYNQGANAYNALVGPYDALATQEKQNAAKYNTEVEAYNKCIAE